MNKQPNKKTKKGGRPRGSKKKLTITGEILSPGTLKRTPSCYPETARQRWERIVNTCAKIIAEYKIKQS